MSLWVNLSLEDVELLLDALKARILSDREPPPLRHLYALRERLEENAQKARAAADAPPLVTRPTRRLSRDPEDGDADAVKFSGFHDLTREGAASIIEAMLSSPLFKEDGDADTPGK